jgi:hypothetical protein
VRPYLSQNLGRRLIIFSHRCTKIDDDVRLQKLLGFINPVKQLWQSPQLNEAVSSFSGFCELLGLTKIKDYLTSRRVYEIPDWGHYPLDEEGQSIQKTLDDRVKVGVPFCLHFQLITIVSSLYHYALPRLSWDVRQKRSKKIAQHIK